MQRPALPRSRTNAGFLLTETLATFTISAFVLLGLVSASSVLLHAVDRSVARVQDVDDLGRTMAAIGRDVSGLSRARWNGVEPQPFVFRGGPNSLYFASAQRDPDGSRDTRVVALREINTAAGPRLTRAEARLSARANGFDGLLFSPPRELGTGAARLRFYYAAADGKPEHARLREWPMGPLLPAMVIVEAVERDTGRRLTTARVPIHADAEIGCLAQDRKTAGGAPSVALAALNQSAVGLAARIKSGEVTPPPAEAASIEPSTFCGRPDQDEAKADESKAGVAAPAAPATGPTP